MNEQLIKYVANESGACCTCRWEGGGGRGEGGGGRGEGGGGRGEGGGGRGEGGGGADSLAPLFHYSPI